MAAIIDGAVCEVSEGMRFEHIRAEVDWGEGELLELGWEGFLRHERALKHDLANLPGRLLDLPGVGRRRFVALIQLSLGRLLLSRACFCFTGQNPGVSRFRFPGGL